MKQTIVIVPIIWRGTQYEKELEPIQVETQEEALELTRKILSMNDGLNWFSVLLDDCGSDEPYKEEIMDLGQPKTEEELQNILEENWIIHKIRTNKIIERYKKDLEIQIRDKIKYEQTTQQDNDFTRKYIEKYTKINEENDNLPF